MPIIEGDNKELVIQFGDGDILINAARHPGADFSNEIAFSQQTPHEIGAWSDEHDGKLTSEIGCPVRLQFSKSASIDVLIERLENVKTQMVASGF